MYSEEQLYQLIGEKNSMKRLLTEVRGSASPPPPASLLPFCGLKALQGGKPFFIPLSTLSSPASSFLRGRTALFCHTPKHQNLGIIWRAKKNYAGRSARDPGSHSLVKHG